MEHSYRGSQIKKMLHVPTGTRSLPCIVKRKNAKCRTVTVDYRLYYKGGIRIHIYKLAEETLEYTGN